MLRVPLEEIKMERKGVRSTSNCSGSLNFNTMINNASVYPKSHL